MSNTDLDLLTRHVHEAPVWARYGYIDSNHVARWREIGSGVGYFFPISEIKAHRDKLTGKPTKWVNDWARWRAQDESGKWIEHSKEPYQTTCKYVGGIWKTDGSMRLVSKGEVIGDCRDTLEERVMGMNYGIPRDTENMTEVPEEQPKWDGNGLPPVGTVCEYWDVGSGLWEQVVITYLGERCIVGRKAGETVEFQMQWDKNSFRPIRTERDKCIEAMVDVLDKLDSQMNDRYSALEALYDSNLFDISLREGG